VQRAIDLGFQFFSGLVRRLHGSGLGGGIGKLGAFNSDRQPLMVSGCPCSFICTAMIAIVPVESIAEAPTRTAAATTRRHQLRSLHLCRPGSILYELDEQIRLFSHVLAAPYIGGNR
jgi:hypothetical protein